MMGKLIAPIALSMASLLRVNSADGRGFGLVGGGGGYSRPLSVVPGLYACVSCLTVPSDFILRWPGLGGLPGASECADCGWDELKNCALLFLTFPAEGIVGAAGVRTSFGLLGRVADCTLTPAGLNVLVGSGDSIRG